jgi:hypothetical protein
MNFNDLSEKEKQKFAELMFSKLSSAEEIRDWVKFFLGLEIPLYITDPDSNSSPLDAIWQIYETFKNNSGDKNPGYVLMSCREGMKTVSVAILEVLLLLHFELEIAHAAATETQSAQGLQYIEDFLLKVEPLMAVSGWNNQTKNKRTVRFKTSNGKSPFIKIVICTAKGMNSLHANVIFFDELDLADPVALKEGVNIVGFSRGIYGVKVYLSTRKYAFGNMAKMLEQAPEKNYRVLQWNILDVTERCPSERHLPDQPREDRYVAKALPLKQMDKTEYESMPESEKAKLEMVQNAYAGCSKCKLLPVCKTRLANKPLGASGGFYKPIVSVSQQFIDNDPDTAEAQLMCWRPGSAGLVYPRFSTKIDTGNVISLKKAYSTLLGYDYSGSVSELGLLYELKKAGVSIQCGVDWGFTHDAVIIVMAKLDNGEIWVLDCFSSPGLEFSDVLDVAMKFRDKYNVEKWWCDQAYPANIKSFNKNGMRSPKFTKDVPGGIEAIRNKIVNASGYRFLKVLATESNKKVISAMTKHKFILDGQGNVTNTPDDEPGISDICDAIRYFGQNVCPVRGTWKPSNVWLDNKPVISDPNSQEARSQALISSQHENQMKDEISKRLTEEPVIISTNKKGGFHFSY